MAGSKRDTVLDFLRGYLLFVIIVNHLRDEPHLYMFITGGTRLWVTAAEGFVLISGYLVGKLRGAEARGPGGLATATRKVLRRAATLALWTVLVTNVLLAISYVTGYHPSIIDSPRGELLSPIQELLLAQVMGYVYGDHNILAAYTLFLAITPVVLWCLLHRHHAALFGVSVTLWLIGLLTPQPFMLTDSNVADLSWQFLFIIGVTGGFHHDELAGWWAARGPAFRHRAVAAAGAITAITLALTWWSRYATHGARTPIEHVLFAHIRLGPGRVVLSIIWLWTAYLLVDHFQKPILRWLGPIFVPLGRASLYVFIVHGLLLFAVCDRGHESFWLSTLLATAAVAIIWLMLRFKVLFGVIPR